MATFISTALSGAIVAVVTVLIAGRRFYSEEQSKRRLEARDKLRTMTSAWVVDIRLFHEGHFDLPRVDHSELERYRMCSAVVEIGRQLSILDQVALRRACRLLFGKQVLQLADDVPASALTGATLFMIDDAMFRRGEEGEGGSRRIELGCFGTLFQNYEVAKNLGSETVYGFPKIPHGQYTPWHLLRFVRVLGRIKWYHLPVLSVQYQDLREVVARLMQYSRRNVPRSTMQFDHLP